MRSSVTPRQTHRGSEAGFTLVELLTSMAITTVIMGATMSALNDAMRATEVATLTTGMNAGLRTTMDLVVRDLLQVGQGLPSGNVISLPWNGAAFISRPGPPATAYTLIGSDPDCIGCPATEMPAVMPGPGLGPVVNGTVTDMITAIAADSAFETRPLTALTNNTMTVALPSAQVINGVDIDDGGGDDLLPGDLIMLTKIGTSTLVHVTAVAGQLVTFAAGDSLNLNRDFAIGSVAALRADDPIDNQNGVGVIPTEATRIRMVSFYLDATTDLTRPRLMRRINNQPATAVAFDIENLQITYDLADGATNPAHVRMDADDIAGAVGGSCDGPCSPNQIRKVNLLMAGRSRAAMKGTRQFFRNQMVTQVSLRSLAFVDRYR